MSKDARAWYLRQKIADGHMKNVLSQLAYMHQSGHDLYPSQKHLAAMAGISPRTAWAALRLLHHFEIIGRTVRTAKNKGRISDLIVLRMDSDFTLNRDAIAAARVVLGLAPTVPKRWFRAARPPRKDCETPSQPLRTNRRLSEEPSQEGESLKGDISTRGEGSVPATRWTPRVIVGGRA